MKKSKNKVKYYIGLIIVVALYWLFFMGPLKDVTDNIFAPDGEAPTPTVVAENVTTESPTNVPSDTTAATPTKTSEKKPTASPEPTKIPEVGSYTSKEEVALFIHTYGKLPSNYITKNEAEKLGWKSGNNSTLDKVAPGKSIGGDSFGNYEKLLPSKSGRKYYECDIDYKSGGRNSKRIIYSNDGLIYYTDDHYETFTLLYGEP